MSGNITISIGRGGKGIKKRRTGRRGKVVVVVVAAVVVIPFAFSVHLLYSTIILKRNRLHHHLSQS